MPPQARQQLQQQQQQLASGKRIELASDDPTGAARSERALAAIRRIEANQRALEASRNAMTLSEAALGDATELMQQARELMLSAGNASYSDAERKGLANKLQGLRDQLSPSPTALMARRLSVLGPGASAPPFLDEATGVRYVGTPGTIQTGNLDNFQLTVDGRAAWEEAQRQWQLRHLGRRQCAHRPARQGAGSTPAASPTRAS